MKILTESGAAFAIKRRKNGDVLITVYYSGGDLAIAAPLTKQERDALKAAL